MIDAAQNKAGRVIDRLKTLGVELREPTAKVIEQQIATLIRESENDLKTALQPFAALSEKLECRAAGTYTATLDAADIWRAHDLTS